MAGSDYYHKIGQVRPQSINKFNLLAIQIEGRNVGHIFYFGSNVYQRVRPHVQHFDEIYMGYFVRYYFNAIIAQIKFNNTTSRDDA